MRWKYVVVATIAVLLSGCGRPAGVDGDLTNDWPAMPEPKLPVPTAPACYWFGMPDTPDVLHEPIPCDSPTVTHNIETFHVGQFTGADADRDTPPPIGGPARRAAYAECATNAKAYLGDDWRVSRLSLAVTVPSATHWDAGARWFRCDLEEFKDLYKESELVPRGQSLKGALAAPSDLRIGCEAGIERPGSTGIDTVSVPCAQPHNLEFAGLYDFPEGPYPTDKEREEQGKIACPGPVAAFLGVPNDRNLTYRIGWVWSGYSKEEWDLGNRGVRCYVWTEKNVTGSVKGAGTRAFPIG